MTEPPEDDFVSKAQQIERDAAETYAEINRQGMLRLVFTMWICLTLLIGSFFIPHGFLIFACLTLLYPLWGLVNLRPGRCLTCGRYTLSSTPKNGVHVAQWWDLRPTPRSKVVWLCPEHIGEYFVWRASGASLGEPHE